MEIRNVSGDFLGILDMTTPPDYRSINVPVYRPCAVRFEPVPPPTAIFYNIVRFERARWCDTDGLRDVWRYDGNGPGLTDARHVILKGATSPTWLDNKIKYQETLKRIVGMLILLKMPTACHRSVH